MPARTTTDRNSSPAVAAREAHAAQTASAVTYRASQGGSSLPPAATSPATFDALQGTMVSAQVAEHVRVLAIYLAACAAKTSHAANLREAQHLDATALAESVSSGTPDPGPVHVTAHKAEADRLARHGDGAATALVAAFKALTDAVREQAGEITATSATEGATHRDALRAATATVVAEAAELDRLAAVDRAVANVLERRWTEVKPIHRAVSPYPVFFDARSRPVHVADLVRLLDAYREAPFDV